MSDYARIDGHPGFYRRNGLVYFRFRDRRGRKRWDSARTIKEAERKKIQRELEVERGDHQDGSRDRFQDYAPSWIDTYQGRAARGNQRDHPRRLPATAGAGGDPVPREDAPVRDRAQGRQGVRPQAGARGQVPNTVRLAVAPVRALLATAVEEGLLRSNPASGLRLAQRRPDLNGEEEQVKAMSEQELRQVLAEVQTSAPGWSLFFRFLAWSGLRIGEAIELRWRDVDLGQRIVHVRRRYFAGRVGPPKSRYGKRRLKLTPELARALWRLRAEAKGADDELVFTVAGGGRVDASNLMGRVLKPAAVEAGLGKWVKDGRKLRAESWVGFHTFRHTCATILFRRGWNAVQVQRWLGHHKPSFTLDTYVHLLDEDVPEPAFFDELYDTVVTQTGLNGLDEGQAAEGGDP
jgi:integrase